MNSISALLNKTLDSLTTDSEAKQSLIENISSLSSTFLYLAPIPILGSIHGRSSGASSKGRSENSFTQVSQNLESFHKELQESKISKNLAASKLANGEARAKDMSSEIALTEQRLRDLKEKKENLDKAVGKL